MTRPTLGVGIFTIIELIALSLWLIGSNVHISILGAILLTLGLFVEHVVAYNVGSHQPPFRFPLR